MNTHTYVELPISAAAWDEIAAKLRTAGYDHAFLANGIIDMHGIGVSRIPADKSGENRRCVNIGPLGPERRVANGSAHDAKATQSSTAAAPQESPLAWLVFVSDHPEGCDYVVFPEEHDAESYAAEREDREVTPLYRTSAFTVSASGLTLDSDARRVLGSLVAYAGNEKDRAFNGHTDWIPLDLNDLAVLRRLLERDDIGGQQR